MIHNPHVNDDLEGRGIRFIMDTEGNQFIDWSEIQAEDIVIIQAFGTTIEIEAKLAGIGVEVQQYNTNCPFVEKVWKMSSKLGAQDHTVIIHGKHKHEETRATFSHSKEFAASMVLKDITEARLLGEIILGNRPNEEFHSIFKGRHSDDFDVQAHLQRIGVVNQTTMLATETQEIADHLKNVMIQKFGAANYKDHFADTRDTLCYATNDNQQATYGLLDTDADLAIVVGGYNSSNTSHIVELCERKFQTYFISSADDIDTNGTIHHFNYHDNEHCVTNNFLPQQEPLGIVLTSGASCPDSMIDGVLDKLLSFFDNVRSKEVVLMEFGGATDRSKPSKR